MGLFDGLGEDDAEKRRANVVRRQCQLLDEQIAEKQALKGGRGRRQDEKAYLRELFERDESPNRQMNQSPSRGRMGPPPQSQIQLARQPPALEQPLAPVPVPQPLHYQQQYWMNNPAPPSSLNLHNQVVPGRPSGHQAFLQQLHQEMLNQPVMQLPSLLAQPLQPQLPKLPALPSAKAMLQTWEAPPRPASLPPALMSRQTPTVPESDLGGDLDAKLRREVPKQLAFSALPEEAAAERLSSKQKKEKGRRASNLIDIDAEWKQWESKRNNNHPLQPPGWRGAVSPQSRRPFLESAVAEAGEGSEASTRVTAAPSPEPAALSPEPSLSQASGNVAVSNSYRERPSQSMVPEGVKRSFVPSPLPPSEGIRRSPVPSPLPPPSAVWVQPPRRSSVAGIEDIRAMAASNLVNDLHKVKRSWLDERMELRSQCDALKKEATRLRAENVTLPTRGDRHGGVSSGPSQRHYEPLSRPLPLVMQPRAEPPTALAYAQVPLDSRSVPFSPSRAGGRAVSFARSPTADALLLGSFSPASGLPEASSLLYDRPDEPRSISTSPLKASMSVSLLPQASHLLYDPPKKPKTISTGAPQESVLVAKPVVSLPFGREDSIQSSQSRRSRIDESSAHLLPRKREELVQGMQSRFDRVVAGSRGPLPRTGTAGPLPPKPEEPGQGTPSSLLRVAESVLVPLSPQCDEPAQSSQSRPDHLGEDSVVPQSANRSEIVESIETESDHMGEVSVVLSSSDLEVRLQVCIQEDSADRLPSKIEELSEISQIQSSHASDGPVTPLLSKAGEPVQCTQGQSDHVGESSALPLPSKLEDKVQTGTTQPGHPGEGLQYVASCLAAHANVKAKDLIYLDGSDALPMDSSLDQTSREHRPAPETHPPVESGPAPASQPVLTSPTASESQPAPQAAPEAHPPVESEPAPASQPVPTSTTASESQAAPQAAAESQPVLESTLRAPQKTADRMLTSTFFGSLQYSDSSGGETPAGDGATMRRRPPADLNKVIDLGAEMKKSQKNEAGQTASSSEDSVTRQRSGGFRQSLRGTQELLISALIKEDGSVGATSDQPSSPSHAASDPTLIKQTVDTGQGGTGGSPGEDPAEEKTAVPSPSLLSGTESSPAL